MVRLDNNTGSSNCQISDDDCNRMSEKKRNVGHPIAPMNKPLVSESETMIISQKRVECCLQVGNEVLPQVEEFKDLVVLLISEGRIAEDLLAYWCGVCCKADSTVLL